MNKKGDLITIACIMIMIILVAFFVALIINNNKKWAEACKDLGFKKDEIKNDFLFYEDFNGDLYFIKMDCEERFFSWATKCTAKEISVGDVRVLKNGG